MSRSARESPLASRCPDGESGRESRVGQYPDGTPVALLSFVAPKTPLVAANPRLEIGLDWGAGMSRFSIDHLHSLGELRASAERWDDLWQRSAVAMPMARAEFVAQWVEQFAPSADFHAIVVEHEGRWVAALPLVAMRLHGVLPAGTMPVNDWAYGGGLLLERPETDHAADALLAALRDLPWPLLWLDWVPLDAPEWQAMRRAMDRAGVGHSVFERYQVGRLEIDHDWNTFSKRWSGKHRSRMRSLARKLEERRTIRLEVCVPRSPEEVSEKLAEGLELEDRGWKGESGSSVLRRGMFPFLLRQAEQLAVLGELELIFLRCEQRPIAFSYGFRAKGVSHSFKIAYDPEFSAYGPGQLMHYYFFQRAFADPDCRAFDFLGEMGTAASMWKPAAYRNGQVVIAPRKLLGRFMVHAHRTWWPYVRRWKARLAKGETKPAQNSRARFDSVLSK